MKTLITLLLTIFSYSAMADALKLEGSCKGKLADGTAVSFKYFSNFDGCSDSAKSAVVFPSGRLEGLLIGTRSFTETRDNYNFKKERVKISFANSTGNTSGNLSYANDSGVTKTVRVSCIIRDYEYGECN